MADTTILDCEKQEAALDEIAEVSLCRRRNRIDPTQNQNRKPFPIGMI
jgi:hypothetical protein